jgi:hypothetical protein
MAAALALSTAVANAQSLYKAKVPFAFQAGRTQLPAGEYELRAISLSGNPVVTLHNPDANKSIVLHVLFPTSGTQWKNPELLFGCGGGNCKLEQLWKGVDGWVFSAPGKKIPGRDYTASVALKPAGSTD